MKLLCGSVPHSFYGAFCFVQFRTVLTFELSLCQFCNDRYTLISRFHDADDTDIMINSPEGWSQGLYFAALTRARSA